METTTITSVSVPNTNPDLWRCVSRYNKYCNANNVLYLWLPKDLFSHFGGVAK